MVSFHKNALVAGAIMAAIIGTAAGQDHPIQQSPSGPAMMGHGSMGPGMMGESGSPGAMCGKMATHIEDRLAHIKAELHVTEVQEPLWTAYAAAARDNAETMASLCGVMMGKRDPQARLPDRLDQNEQLMTAHLDAVRTMIKALKPLYMALDDNQKKTADQLFWSPNGMM